MAHFCKLNFWNKVERVEVVSNDIATTEQAGIDFLNNLYKTNDVWVQTSYNEKILLVLDLNMTKLKMLLYHLNHIHHGL